MPYSFTPGTNAASSQVNSNFYAAALNEMTLIGLLNATGASAYACAPCISALTNGTGITTSLGAQSSGVGVNATIGLSHGDYMNASPTSISVNGAAAPNPGDIGSAVSATSGLMSFGTSYGVSYFEYGVNHAGAFTLQGGPLYLGAAGKPVPYDSAGTSGGEHIERGFIYAPASGASVTFNFAAPFSATPNCSVAWANYSSGTHDAYNGDNASTTGVTIYYTLGSMGTQFDVLCIGN